MIFSHRFSPIFVVASLGLGALVSAPACSSNDTGSGSANDTAGSGTADGGVAPSGSNTSAGPSSDAGPGKGSGGNDAGEPCGGICGANQVCQNDMCVDLPAKCPCPAESYCDLSSDSCVKGCTSDDQCNAGRWCDTTTRTCKNGCRGTSECTSPTNGTASCTDHACTFTCSSKHHACGVACADDTSVSTCGASCTPCTPPAHATSTCDGKACGFSCASGFADCNSDPKDGCEHAVTPITCYRDADGDGYGLQATTQSFPCGVCPSGWVAKNDVFDCNDTNAKAYPGEPSYYSTGPSFDYDCDGKIEKEDGQYAHQAGACYIQFPADMQCGETRELYICLPNNVEDFTRGCK